MPTDEAAALPLGELFEGLGTERLAYAPRCHALSGGWLQLDTLITRSHDGSRWMAVDQPGVCPDCADLPVAAVDLPGFEPPAGMNPTQPLRLRGRLAYGFAVDAQGQASFLRLEGAELVDGGAA